MSTRLLGDVSYSTYLLHFPLQLLIVDAAAYYGFQINFNRPSIVLFFLAVLLLLSVLTYYYFERPVQYFIRRKLSNLRKNVAGHALRSA